MKSEQKTGRYERVRGQLEELLRTSEDHQARMATIASVLHHKFPYYFWTGFYRLREDGSLLVGPYQGPLACQVLEAGRGVCGEAIRDGKTVIVADVTSFPDHIACDSRSRSEIVVPFRDAAGKVVGVLDVDSDKPSAFDENDQKGLESILELLIRD